MDADQVVELLRRKVEEAGSQADFCRMTGVVDYQRVHRMLAGKAKNPPRAILRALGLKVAYEPINKEEQ